MRRAPVYVLEGTWWSHREVPLILPYLSALAGSHGEIDLSHRTVRSADDISYYLSKIPRNAGAFVYFACHGSDQKLLLTDKKSAVGMDELAGTFEGAKEGAISFVHFGCCEFIAARRRREVPSLLMKASDARWVSGYTKSVDWLPSTFVDLALISEVFVPFYKAKHGRGPRLGTSAKRFLKSYDRLARDLGFSALSRISGSQRLFPARLHNGD